MPVLNYFQWLQYVSSLVVDGPAATCGEITVGDELVAVNGVSLFQFSADRVAQLILGQKNTLVKMRFSAIERSRFYLVELRRGVPGNRPQTAGSELSTEDGPIPITADDSSTPMSPLATAASTTKFGLCVDVNPEGRFVVVSTTRDSIAGVSSFFFKKDILLSIGGRTLEGMSLEQV